MKFYFVCWSNRTNVRHVEHFLLGIYCLVHKADVDFVQIDYVIILVLDCMAYNCFLLNLSFLDLWKIRHFLPSFYRFLFVIDGVTQEFNALSLYAHMMFECIHQIFRKTIGFLERFFALLIVAAAKPGHALAKGFHAKEFEIKRRV